MISLIRIEELLREKRELSAKIAELKEKIKVLWKRKVIIK